MLTVGACAHSHSARDACVPTPQSEFESVKAASKVAADLAPDLEAMSTPKRGKRNLWQKSKALIGLGKELRQASVDVVEDSCDIDEPEVCEDDAIKGAATREVRGLMAKTLRFARGRATSEELESDEATGGDSMEMGWQSRGQGSACVHRIAPERARTLAAARAGGRSSFALQQP